MTLQPISVEANTGVILSAGVGHLSLRYAPEPVVGRHGRHHGRFCHRATTTTTTIITTSPSLRVRRSGVGAFSGAHAKSMTLSVGKS